MQQCFNSNQNTLVEFYLRKGKIGSILFKARFREKLENWEVLDLGIAHIGTNMARSHLGGLGPMTSSGGPTMVLKIPGASSGGFWRSIERCFCAEGDDRSSRRWQLWGLSVDFLLLPAPFFLFLSFSLFLTPVLSTVSMSEWVLCRGLRVVLREEVGWGCLTIWESRGPQPFYEWSGTVEATCIVYFF